MLWVEETGRMEVRAEIGGLVWRGDHLQWVYAEMWWKMSLVWWLW